ncbi:unnamed protein product [Brassica oleracea]
METGRIRIRRSIPESVVVEIIARFKSVCKQWRSLIESSYFRSLFVSLHRNSSSSSSWSLMFPIKYQSPITEAIGFYGCERWDLPKSPASHIIPCQPYPNQDYYYYYVASSNGLVWNEQIYPLTSKIKANAFVGNPVTQECVEITPPPDPVNKPLYFGYASCERCRFKLQAVRAKLNCWFILKDGLTVDASGNNKDGQDDGMYIAEVVDPSKIRNPTKKSVRLRVTAEESLIPTETRRRRSIPDVISIEIIARFKSVCKQWRLLIESPYFLSLFVSLHSWSLMFPMRCKRGALPKYPASYLFPFQPYPNIPPLDFYYVDSSHGLIWVEVNVGTDDNFEPKSFVGNPVSQEWVEIPPPPDRPVTIPFSLVTHAVNGVVSIFKVRENVCMEMRVYVYSSETGAWTFKTLRPPSPLQRAGLNRPLNLNGVLYVWEKRLDDYRGPGV